MVGNSVPRHKIIKGELRERIFSRIEQEENSTGYVDFITLSSSILFSMKYKLSVQDMRKEALYNNIRKTGYPECTDYLEGLEIVSCDYKEVFNRYKDIPGVVFLVDPPYLSTDVGTYNMYWNMADYLDVLNVLKGHSYVYFTSNKSSILELCEWIGKNRDLGNPFEKLHKGGIQCSHELQLFLHRYDALQERGCLIAFTLPVLNKKAADGNLYVRGFFCLIKTAIAAA